MQFPLKGWNQEALKKHLREHPTARYGALRDGGKRRHKGFDFYGEAGQFVFNIRRGTVVLVGAFYRGTFAVWVEVGPNHFYGYCELDPDIPVKEGDLVEPGEALGMLGYFNPPIQGFPEMLHFEELIGPDLARAENVNPLYLLEKLEVRE